MKDASNDVNTIRLWSTSYVDANWGLACGRMSGVIVIDIDRKKGGFDAIDEFEQNRPEGPIPRTLLSISGGGGRHIFLNYPSDGNPINNRVNWLPGIDIRSDGGYVILPPGTHISGGRYQWVDADAPIADLPLDIAAAMRVPSRAHGKSNLEDTADILAGVPEGQRDDTLFRAACRWRRMHEHDGDGGRAAVTALVMTAAARSGFPTNEAMAKIEQAFKQDHSSPDMSWSWRDNGDQRDRLVNGGTFVLDEPEQIPAVWGHGEFVLWAEGEGLMIAGHQGLGKTTIAQQIVLSRLGVLDDQFLGLPVASSKGRVLYLAMDRPRQAARSFRRMVHERDRTVMNQRLMVWRGPLPINPTEKGAFINWVRDVCPDVDTLVVDSVKDLAPGVVEDGIASALNSSWQSVIAEGIELLLLHHERKAASDSRRTPSLDNVYGSTWLTSGLGSVIALAGEPGSDEVALHHVKQPAETVGPLDVRHDHKAGRTTPLLDARLTVEDALALAPSTVSGIAHLTGLSEKTVRRRLKELEGRGIVQRAKGPMTSEGRTAEVFTLVPGNAEIS